ncbi:MAG: ADP-ribosylglycohydrolase family protein [Oscillospiraceae bacterium]|nr:ADP-ribosylglycohydrolase family protein [Oscillospiraceae bacterium]
MLGAIIGDIVGSRFECNNYRAKDFELFTDKCSPTDDSIMSLAVAKAILNSKPDHSDLSDAAVRYMQQLGRLYPNSGYGMMFRSWLMKRAPQPYGSFGNGAAMRVSAVGFAAQSLADAKIMSDMVTKVTHNHPEGIKGAEAAAVAVFMAHSGKSALEICDVIDKEYYPMDFTLDEIRGTYMFNSSCQGTVPQALMAFFESTGFEDAIRNAISIGGDSDTLAAITGGIAEAYYGIPDDIRRDAISFLDERQLKILLDFESKYPPVAEKARQHRGMSGYA